MGHLMKISHFLIAAALSGASFSVDALDRKRCVSKIFQNFERLENTGHSKVLARPKGDLLKLSHQYELTCPWQVEGDFNGDKQIDWAGVAQKDGKYELLVYLSGPRKYFYRHIKTYDAFPKDTYFTVATYKKIFETAKGQVPSIFPAQFTFVENRLRKRSVAYGWVENKVSPIHYFESEYVLEKEVIEEQQIPEKKVKTILDER